MISFAHVAIGDGGCILCARCDAAGRSELRITEGILGDLRCVSEGWDAGPGPNVAFVDAEPFAHPDLPAIVSGAAGLGFERIRLRTDGGALADEANARGAVHAGVRHIQLAVLGEPSTHDDLAQSPGLFASAAAGARAFSAALEGAGAEGVLTGWIPVCRHNLEALPGAIAALAEMGAVSVELDLTESARKALSARSWVEAALETGAVNGVWVHVRGADEPLATVFGLHATAPSRRWRA